MKHTWSIDRLLKNPTLLNSGTGKNLFIDLYNEISKPENKLTKKDLKISASTYNDEILNSFF